MEATSVSNGWTLPRGRHRLPAEMVAAHQRDRLLDAATDAAAEHGQGSVTVAHVIDLAGVSRRTFYEQFGNIQDCLYAAHEVAFEHLTRRIFDACASQEEWPDGVVAAVSAALDFAVSTPARAQLLLAAGSAGDPQLARRAQAVRDQLAGLLRSGRERCPQAPAAPELVEHALIGGVMAVVGDRVLTGQSDRLASLKPEVVQLLLAPYLGVSEARAFVAAS